VLKAAIPNDVFSYKAPVGPEAKIIDKLESVHSNIIQKHGIVHPKHHKGSNVAPPSKSTAPLGGNVINSLHGQQ